MKNRLRTDLPMTYIRFAMRIHPIAAPAIGTEQLLNFYEKSISDRSHLLLSQHGDLEYR